MDERKKAQSPAPVREADRTAGGEQGPRPGEPVLSIAQSAARQWRAELEFPGRFTLCAPIRDLASRAQDDAWRIADALGLPRPQLPDGEG